MTTALTKVEFAEILRRGCGNPDCKDCGESADVLHFRQPCHPSARLDISYHRVGYLVIRCDECREVVLTVQVAAE